MKLLTIIGARPQIIKAAAISRAICSGVDARGVPFKSLICEKILHTGQHYDENMSGTFFAELGVPEPDYNLHVGSGPHGVQTARMVEGIEQVLAGAEKDGHGFDGVLLYGDTNSTLAGAVAAGKMHVPVFHVEAGLRSYNMAMPEEQNRIVCDQLSSVLFAPTRTAVDNLQKEGFPENKRRFRNGKGQKVVLAGDVMYDNSMYFASMAEGRSDIMQRVGLAKNQFILATIHRDNNTDNSERMSSIFRALLQVAEQQRRPIVLPLHPRTRKMMKQSLSVELYGAVTSSSLIHIIEPAGFFDIIQLERNASLVMTDSGGVQKEAFFFETPCVILRPETEWTEIVVAGAGILADADEERIIAAADRLAGQTVHFPQLFGNGHASVRILEEIVNYLS